MNDREAITEKIKKLLALSESPNQHEAESAMAKVNKLLEQHQIEMSEVLVEEIKTNGAFKGETIEISETYRSFIRTLAGAAAHLCDVGHIGAGRQSTVFFVGTRADVKLAESLFHYLFDSWKAIVRADCAEWKYECGFTGSNQPRQYEVKKYKIGHGQGFSNTVKERAYNLSRDRKEKVEKSGDTGTELIVLKDQLVTDYIDEFTHKSRSNYKRQSDGHTDGALAGENIPLSGAIDEDNKRIGN